MSDLELQECLAQLRQHLEAARADGVPLEWLEPELFVSAPPETTLTAVVAPEVFEQTVYAQDSTSAVPVSDIAAAGFPVTRVSTLDWEALRVTALSCTSCRLCETRTNVVFGVGKQVQPILAFVGEGPGADEDRVGEPFVGKAGQLLTAAITKGMGLKREDVYIANVVKCRPPENRTPLPDEVASCTPFLFRQLELLQPKVIVALGGPAQLALTGVQQGITKLRGRWLEWNGIKVMPTFHPAYILRNPAAKREFWEDLQEVMRAAGLPVAGVATGNGAEPVNR